MNEQDQRSDEQDLEAFAELTRLLQSSWITQSIQAAAELRLADSMASGINTLDGLAAATGCHPPSLYRLLRALSSLGICEEQADRCFALTSLGSLLQANAPASVRTLAIWVGSQWSAWGDFLHSVRTGECARAVSDAFADHPPLFDQFERNRPVGALFHHAMSEATRCVAAAVVRAYDFSAFARVVDVGGGRGEMLAAILRAYPGVHGVLFDLPNALDSAREYFTHLGATPRCDFVPGNFFESIPNGGNAYVLKSVLHDWQDERATIILRRCRDAMARDAKLLLVEQILPMRMERSLAHQDIARRDLTMLVMLGSQERSATEYGNLLHAADFRITRIVPTALNFHVIEAAPV